MGVVDQAVARVLPAVPRRVVQRLSAPYIAGPTLDDARRCVASLAAEGKRATVAVLAEEIGAAEEARGVASQYHDVLAALASDRLDAGVSVKLTGLGLKLDRDLCRALLEAVVVDAARRGSFVRIDMEDASCADDTLELYRELRAAGYEHVGVVLQARLKRTMADIAELDELRPNVRLCKGIYVESPHDAFRDDGIVRRSFVACLDALLAGGSHVAIATHDEWLLTESLARVHAVDTQAYELEMLLGVRGKRADQLVAAGHPLRVYVPFGQQWYEYSVRRLQENPRMAGIVAKSAIGRLVGRG